MLILFGPHALKGQYVKNVIYSAAKDSLNANRYLINYDLIAPYNNIPCVINLRLTTGEKGEQSYFLKNVTGDVGDLVYPGAKKLIVWDFVEELVHFSGEISLSVEATPSVKVQTKIKKGREIELTLVPFFESNKMYALKLYRSGKEITPLSDIFLDKGITVLIPKKTKVRKDYQLAIADGQKIYFSNTFKVRRRVSLGWLSVPIVAVPAYILIKQYLEDNKPLPGPPSGITGN